MGVQLVDWDLAVTTARRLARSGPPANAAEAAAVVAALRDAAAEADEHVGSYTQLTAARTLPPVVVVDRPEWARSNVAGLRVLLDPVLEALVAKQRPGRVAQSVGKRVTGVQLGTALGWLSSRVLGQYEVFLPSAYDGQAGPDGGRLSLVAPNIVQVQRGLEVDPADFRMWVCLHEQTHRIQFTGVPWLRGYLEDQVGEFVEASDLDPAALAERLRGAVAALRGRDQNHSFVEALQTPEQRAILDRLQAAMTVLEGHAEHVMDAVGPTVVPSVGVIRSRFEARRGGGSPLDRFVRRLLGLDLKLRQYRQGKVFVSAVVDRVGVAGFNQIWAGPDTLPSRAEIADPDAWTDRVLGVRPAASA